MSEASEVREALARAGARLPTHDLEGNPVNEGYGVSASLAIRIDTTEDGWPIVRYGATGEPIHNLSAAHLEVDADDKPTLARLRFLAYDFGKGMPAGLTHGRVVNLTVTMPVRVEVTMRDYTKEHPPLESGLPWEWTGADYAAFYTALAHLAQDHPQMQAFFSSLPVPEATGHPT